MSKLKELALAGVNKSTVTLRDGTEVELRSMLVKEYKQLMIANKTESGQIKTMFNILQGCILSDGIDLRKIPAYDFEMLYLELWKLSKGASSIKVAYQCKNRVPALDGEGNILKDGGELIEKECGTTIGTVIDLTKVEYTEAPESDVVKINERLSVKLRYPTVFENEYFDEESDANVFDLTMRCITHVIDSDEIMEVGKDIEQEDLVELVDYLGETSFEKLTNWIESMPMVSSKIALKCPKCGNQSAQTLIGLADFFE